MFRWLLMLVPALNLFGQSVEGPVFEVASLKKIGPTTHAIQPLKGGPGSEAPNQVVMINQVAELVFAAFDLPASRISIETRPPNDFYELNALVPVGASKDDLRTMYRNLLIERFHLKFHRETREMNLYEMAIAGGGHKLKPSSGVPPANVKGSIVIGARTTDGYADLPPGLNIGPVGFASRWVLQRVGTTMDEFTRDVERQLGRVVVNQTGLNGKYDFSLRWSTGLSAGQNAAEFSEPAFLPALREQLGLVLRDGKGSMEVVVIDAMDAEALPN